MIVVVVGLIIMFESLPFVYVSLVGFLAGVLITCGGAHLIHKSNKKKWREDRRRSRIVKE